MQTGVQYVMQIARRVSDVLLELKIYILTGILTMYLQAWVQYPNF